MNTFVPAAIAAAGLDDARVWERQEPAMVTLDASGLVTLTARGPEADIPWGGHPFSAAHYADRSDKSVVYPSGLVLPIGRVNWFWEYPNDLRQGTAEQAVRHAIQTGADPEQVFPVDPSRVQGTYVRYEGQRADGRDYRLVHARGFPARAGV